MDQDRAIRIGWVLWPILATGAIALLIVFGMRDEDDPDSLQAAGTTGATAADALEAQPASAADERSSTERLGSAAPVDVPITESIDASTLSVAEATEEVTPDVTATVPPPSARELTLEERARALAEGIGTRLTAAVEYAEEHVDSETLREGGEKLGRFVPFVGPYLRYAEARELYRQEDAAARERARRLVVIALADLALDAGSVGLSKTAAGSGSALQILDGAVDLAELSAIAWTIRDAFGDERSVESLAGRALDEVEGLDLVVENLLTVDVQDELGTLPAELRERGRSLVEAVEQALQGSD